MLARIAASPSGRYIALAFSFVTGIVVHAFDERSWIRPAAWLTAASLLLPPILFGRRGSRLVFACLLAAVLALWRYDWSVSGLPEGVNPPPEDVFSGRVASQPRRGLSATVLVMDRIVLPSGSEVTGPARLVVAAPERVRYGDILTWRCRPTPIPRGERLGMSGDFFLKKMVWQCRLRAPPVVVASGQGSMPKAALLSFRTSVSAAVSRLFHEPEAAFLMGLLVGERAALPPRLIEDFRSTGTTHILAVSGYNVSRLTGALVMIFACAGVRRRRAAALSIAAIIAYAVLVGGEASVVRAAVMGSTSLLAAVLGRRDSSVSSLVTAAALMLAANPLILRHDIGFLLSFASVLGLFLLAPRLVGQMRFLPETAGLRRTAAETLAATAATFPLVLYAFGSLPLVGLITNLMVLPLIPPAMGLGALAVLLGAIGWHLGALPAFLATLLLKSVEVMVAFGAAALPAVTDIVIGPATVAILYGWLAVIWWALPRIGIRHRLPQSVDAPPAAL